MSDWQAVFQVALPLETVMAIQNHSNLDNVINDLNDCDYRGEYNVIQDISRNVVATIKTVPFHIAPTAAPINNPQPTKEAPQTRDQYRPSDPFWRLKSLISDSFYGPKSPKDTPEPTGFEVPALPIAKSVIAGGDDEVSSVGEHGWTDGKINFTITDLMNKEEAFTCADSYTFSEVVEWYADRRGIPASNLSFEVEGSVIAPWEFDLTLHRLCIDEGSFIHARPKPKEDVEITVTVIDTMHREVVLKAKGTTTTIRELLLQYEDEVGLAYGTVQFEYEGKGFKGAWERETSLDEAGITDNAVIHASVSAASVPPKHPRSNGYGAGSLATTPVPAASSNTYGMRRRAFGGSGWGGSTPMPAVCPRSPATSCGFGLFD